MATLIKRLIEKLKSYGIGGRLVRWIEDFLPSRTMKVSLRGTFSKLVEVLNGVPQRSVLGPLLFFLFVNELPTWIRNSIMKMFADDTKMWTRIGTSADSITLQEDLDRLVDWSNRWQLKSNPDRCTDCDAHRIQTKHEVLHK